MAPELEARLVSGRAAKGLRSNRQKQAPELEVHGFNGEAVLLVQLACKLQAEVGLPGCTLTAHLGSCLGCHAGHVEHVPQQTALSMIPEIQQSTKTYVQMAYTSCSSLLACGPAQKWKGKSLDVVFILHSQRQSTPDMPT